MNVNGTLIWYYHICKREVWLMYNHIVPDQNDENIALGRFMHEITYQRQEKEISFGHVKFDIMMQTKDHIVIGETKKSDRYEEASRYQLLYYLSVLKEAGISASGLLLYPSQKKRVKVELALNEEKKLKEIIRNIDIICSQTEPPEVEKNRFCKRCGYREYCYA
ncbi:CRISPR-associated protein Cas4 [Vallitalea pronyensis]|uniref:CRISPR-associated exonuclease Cas4 n=1 Tax=Vallitalea pronyensis TaxID=1348613 RepID=A0A8J8MLJ8_9FIRM|nr:CRISPR-associated protein Cas4 [Vallitalea pronyensis]QUI23975.1 CRISPR-associated protein Cas4 [Vallitalea pronyensis]